MSAPVKSIISWLQQTSSGVPSRQSCAEVHGTNVKVRSVFHVTPEALATFPDLGKTHHEMANYSKLPQSTISNLAKVSSNSDTHPTCQKRRP